MPHETFDMFQTAMAFVAQAFGQFALTVEGQLVFATFGGEMQMTTHRPKKIFGFAEAAQLFAGEDVLLCKFFC